MRPFLTGLIFLTATALPAQTSTAGWQSDLRLLQRELSTRHPGAFANISRSQWDSAVTSLSHRIPRLNPNERVIEVFRLIAFLGDAHSVVQPTPNLKFRHYPLELYQFEDGLFVRRADSAHRALVGAKVLRIGNRSAEEAVTAAAGIISHENDWWVRNLAPFWLMVPEVLDGLDLVVDPERLPLVVEHNGMTETVVIAPAGFMGHGNTEAFDTQGWISMRSGATPLYEQQPGEMLWWKLLPENRTLYVSQRGVVPGPRSATNRAQWDQIFALADSAHVDKLIIDIRDNGGGNGGLNRYPVQQILRRPALDQQGHLFVITGRRTFSAAQQFANLLEAWTQTTFVGEPTGQKPSQYGDRRPFELPNSHVLIQLSTVYHQAPNEFDQRSFVPPAWYTPMTSADYAAGRDPALETILSGNPLPPTIEGVQAAIERGDSAAAEQALRTGQNGTINRYRSLESEMNGLGYRLLGGGQTAQAVQVFQINTVVYSTSANTFDSLGEALLAANRRDDAIAAYRRALQVEPGFPPSAQALERLGMQ